MAKKKTPTEVETGEPIAEVVEAKEPTGPRRISVDLPPELSDEIDLVASKSKLLSPRAIREIVRTAASSAASSATIGRVAELVRAEIESSF